MDKNDNAIHIHDLTPRQVNVSLLIIASLFFIFGFVSWLNAILIPYFKIACELTNFESYFVAFAFYISYLIMSVPSSFLLKRIGFKKGIMMGFWIMAIGAFLFIPAAMTRKYEVFLMGLFSIGIGLALLQTAANPYVTLLGPKESAARRISIMGVCNKGAGILAPLIFAAVILRSTDSELFKQIPLMGELEKDAALDELIRRVIVPYAVAGSVLFLLGLAIRFSSLPEINTDRDEATGSGMGNKTIFDFPHLILGAVAIFLHVGTQIIAIDTIIGYATSMGMTLAEAKGFPSYTLAATIIGYFTGISLIPRVITQLNMLRICTVMGLAFSFLIIFTEGHVTWAGHAADISIWFVVLLGLANSLVWAGIWPLALDGLGKFTKLGASIMIMGLCGNAVLPLVYGKIADLWNVREAYWVLVPCYLYLIFYAFRGYGIRSWKRTALETVKG